LAEDCKRNRENFLASRKERTQVQTIDFYSTGGGGEKGAPIKEAEGPAARNSFFAPSYFYLIFQRGDAGEEEFKDRLCALKE